MITDERVEKYPAENTNQFTQFELNGDIRIVLSENMYDWLSSVNWDLVTEMFSYAPLNSSYHIQFTIPIEKSERYVNIIYIFFKRYGEELHYKTVQYIENFFKQYQYEIEEYERYKNYRWKI